MPKTEFLQIRMTPENRQHLSRVAEADHLDESTWARRAILQALERWDATNPHGRFASDAGPNERREQQRRVAEAKPKSPPKPRSKSTPASKAKTATKRKPRE